MKRILIVQPWVPKYRIEFFRNLKQMLEKNGIALHIVAPLPPKEFLPRGDFAFDEEIYTVISSRRFSFWGRELTYYKIPREIRNQKFDLLIFEQSLHTLNLYYYLLYPKWRRKVILWGHGKTTTKKKSIIEHSALLRLTKLSKHFLSYTQSGAEYLLANGYASEKISILVNSNYSIKTISRIERIELKREARNYFSTTNHCVYIGAFDVSKKLEFLIDSLPEIATGIEGFALTFFGDGPLRNLIENACTKYDFVSYGGVADSKKKEGLIGRTKLILNPGRVGLIAVDSIVLGIPIATTNFGFHAPEFEYINNGKMSLVSEYNTLEYSNSVIKLLRNPKRLEQMAQRCRKTRRSYTIESMANNFSIGVRKVLDEID